MNAAKHDNDPWIMQGLLGLFRHPEWVRNIIILVAGLIFMFLCSVKLYFAITGFIDGRLDMQLARLNTFETRLASIEETTQDTNSRMMDRKTFRTFLLRWDSAHPDLPAVPLYDRTIMDGSGFSVNQPNANVALWEAQQ